MASKVNKDHPEQYVVLEHLTLPDRGFRFWTTNTDDNTHGYNGELWYKEVIFTDSKGEAIEHATKTEDNVASTRELKQYYQEKFKKEKEDERFCPVCATDTEKALHHSNIKICKSCSEKLEKIANEQNKVA